ncbi:MAG: xanthan lyase [Bacteroidales bacterium]|nr:xanthan lyase [Bacteroidales bacterium]
MKHKILLALALAAGGFSAGAQQLGEAAKERVLTLVNSTLEHDMLIGKVKLQALECSADTLKVNLSENYAHNYLTPEMIAKLKADIQAQVGAEAGTKRVQINAGGVPVERYFYDFPKKHVRKHEPFISEADPNRRYAKALDGNLIAFWHSHGLYYEPKINCWEWQRPRLFETIEDLYPMSYVIPFVMPMLENAGAYVFNPRERDLHRVEMIVDADGALAQTGYTEHNGKKAWADAGIGFAHKQATYKDFENPFTDGSARMVEAVKKGDLSKAVYDVDMPEAGDYAIYISYKTLPNSVNDAQYIVNASGIERTFTVNQRMSGGVWVYLGTFPLKKGVNKGVLTVTNASRCKGGVVTTDAIKVGGGMGNIARCALPATEENAKRAGGYDWSYGLQKEGVDYKYITSGAPRFVEGSRSFLQWCGFPDSVYSVSHGLTDYADDFRSRSEWVNYLAGGSQAIPEQEHGLRVPLDLSFAFHTDAGVTKDNSTIGTLSIYRSNDFGHYADGTPRIVSRYLADLVGRQLVDDARAKFDPHWTNRGLTQRNLYEIRVPQIPGMLLEYLSHQNFADMRIGLDPDFIFSSSRAIYKGILKFIGKRDHRDVVVQPLPVNSFAITPKDGGYLLSWAPTVDSLEATAVPTKYIVAERIGASGGAFKEIAVVETPECMVKVTDNEIHSYRIVAMNDGGRSFPSEVLSLGVAPAAKGTAMVVNAFTRVSAPDWVDEGDFATFTDDSDHGVPYIQGINYIGSQYEKRRSTGWSDARGGHGSSHSDYQGSVIAGNTFDFPAVHGESLMAAGYSFVSTSAKAVEAGMAPLEGYQVIDIIGGKQKETIVGYGAYPSKYRLFSAPLMQAVENATRKGASVLLTGAYVASDVFDRKTPDAAEVRFAKEVLGYAWGGNKASSTGEVYTLPTFARQIAPDAQVKYCNTLNSNIYCVESPNSIFAADTKGTPFMRYKENNRNAAIVSDREGYRTAVLGFPFETIESRDVRDALMQQILNFFAAEK